MPAGDRIGATSGNHLRVLQSRLRSIEQLCDRLEAAARDQESLPHQRQLLDLVATLRRSIAAFAHELGLNLRTQRSGQELHAAVNFLELALEDLSPARLNAYGKTPPDLAALLEARIPPLGAVVAQMADLLRASG